VTVVVPPGGELPAFRLVSLGLFFSPSSVVFMAAYTAELLRLFAPLATELTKHQSCAPALTRPASPASILSSLVGLRLAALAVGLRRPGYWRWGRPPERVAVVGHPALAWGPGPRGPRSAARPSGRPEPITARLGRILRNGPLPARGWGCIAALWERLQF